MKVTYLDLKTGKTAQEAGISEFQLTENNWSCDCNRCRAFGLMESGDYCLSQRFIVISVEAESEDEPFDTADVIARANSDYYNNIITGDGLEADWVEIDGGRRIKVTRYSICRPVEGLCKSWAIWGSGEENNSTSPLVYLTRPKWIKDDASWEKIVNSIKLSLPSDTQIS